jgi:hypothetical protein
MLDSMQTAGSLQIMPAGASIHTLLLPQATPGTWGALVAQGSSKELQVRRSASIQRKYDADLEEAQQRLEQKKKAEK